MCGPPPSPHPARSAATAASSASSGRRLVRVLLGSELERCLAHCLEVALLDRQRPVDEARDLALPRPLVERPENLPVADLPGLRHREELEAVERVGCLVEVR